MFLAFSWFNPQLWCTIYFNNHWIQASEILNNLTCKKSIRHFFISTNYRVYQKYKLCISEDLITILVRKFFEIEIISIACARYNVITDLYLCKAIKSLTIILNSNILITYLTIVCLCMWNEQNIIEILLWRNE